MATIRDNPYGVFNFLVTLGGAQGAGQEGTIIGGFSDVSGLGFKVNYSQYRNGNEMVNTVRHVNNTTTHDEITLRRGVVGSDDLFAWLKGVSDGTPDPRTITITLLDEARNPVVTYRVLNATPSAYMGPTLAAKGGGEVAMEELHLVHEGIEYQ
jgi:phage tail-like protein